MTLGGGVDIKMDRHLLGVPRSNRLIDIEFGSGELVMCALCVYCEFCVVDGVRVTLTRYFPDQITLLLKVLRSSPDHHIFVNKLFISRCD